MKKTLLVMLVDLLRLSIWLACMSLVGYLLLNFTLAFFCGVGILAILAMLVCWYFHAEERAEKMQREESKHPE